MNRLFAAITATVAIAALVVQFILLTGQIAEKGGTMTFALWRFLGFFTFLTNLWIALVAALIAIDARSALTSARGRFMAASSIALVGIVYTLALRGTWQPQGWQAVADHALHDAVPLLFSLTWLFGRHGALRWFDGFLAALVPIAYGLYALARGTFDGWYAYWFFDPNRLSVGQMLLSFLALCAAFLLIALIFIAIDHLLSRKAAMVVED